MSRTGATKIRICVQLGCILLIANLCNAEITQQTRMGIAYLTGVPSNNEISSFAFEAWICHNCQAAPSYVRYWIQGKGAPFPLWFGQTLRTWCLSHISIVIIGQFTNRVVILVFLAGPREALFRLATRLHLFNAFCNGSLHFLSCRTYFLDHLKVIIAYYLRPCPVLEVFFDLEPTDVNNVAKCCGACRSGGSVGRSCIYGNGNPAER